MLWLYSIQTAGSGETATYSTELYERDSKETTQWPASKTVDINELDEQIAETKIAKKFDLSDWYKDIVSYLLTLKCPSDLTSSKARMLKLHVVKYCIAERQLYWKDPLGFLLVCLVESETEKVISQFHEGVCGGHHAWREKNYKILRAGYY